MTLGEIKANSLNKMFATDEMIDADSIEYYQANDDCKNYLTAMPSVINEALQRIKTYAGINPAKITNETKNADEIKDKNGNLIPEDACVLIPLYVASQLYKDDDISQATQYRNEFEIGLQELVVNIINPTEIENTLGGDYGVI